VRGDGGAGGTTNAAVLSSEPVAAPANFACESDIRHGIKKYWTSRRHLACMNS
jgi:hypothetical protein